MRVKVTIKIDANIERTKLQLRDLGFDPQSGEFGSRDIFVVIPDDYDRDGKIGTLPDVVSVLLEEPQRKQNETGDWPSGG